MFNNYKRSSSTRPCLKRKKKKVTFSLLDADTFEDIEKMRKIREEHLQDYVYNKKRTNTLLENVQNEIPLEHLKKLEELKLKQQKETETFTSNTLEEDENKDSDNNYSNIYTNNNINQNFNNIKTSVSFGKTYSNPDFIDNNNMDFPNLENLQETGNFSRAQDELKRQKEEQERLFKEQQEKFMKEQQEKSEKLLKEQQEKNEKLLREQQEMQKQQEKELAEKIKRELEEKYHREAEERIKSLSHKANIITLNNTLKRIFEHSLPRLKIYFDLLINYMKIIANSHFDYWIDFERNDLDYNRLIEKKKRFFIAKIYYTKFKESFEHIRKERIIKEENENKALKFKLYRRYKMKVLTFDTLNKYSHKQKAWIRATQSELLKSLVWSCIDSLKLYVNYKKIKRYLISNKTKKIFDALKSNKYLSIEMAKRSKKLSLIFEYKHFFTILKKKLLLKKGYGINAKIVDEFRRQNLMKRSFGKLQQYYYGKKEKENRAKKKFCNKYEGKDYINVIVTQKETVRFKGEMTYKRTSNKINIV